VLVSRVAGDRIARARKVFTAFHEIAAGPRVGVPPHCPVAHVVRAGLP